MAAVLNSPALPGAWTRLTSAHSATLDAPGVNPGTNYSLEPITAWNQLQPGTNYSLEPITAWNQQQRPGTNNCVPEHPGLPADGALHPFAAQS